MPAIHPSRSSPGVCRTKVTLFGRAYEVTAASLTGRRESNQDCFGWVAVSSGKVFGSSSSGEIRPSSDDREDLLLAVVCDGMGGLEDGSEASRTVVEGLMEWALSSPEAATGEGQWGLLRRVAELEGEVMSRYPGSGTTVSAVLAADRGWVSVHLGDSRCYAFSDRLRWRTSDHSPAESMFRQGLISEDEMKSGPMSNIVSAFIGGGHAAETEVEDVPKGWDRLLLCSDGAFGFMDSDTFRRLAVTAEDSLEVARIAYDFGSNDNITVLTVRSLDLKERIRGSGRSLLSFGK